MITCTLTYDIDPTKVDAFEIYAKAWIHLVTRLGGVHHGYFLPHEGANDRAWAMFSFPSLADYEAYRAKIADDAECAAVFQHARETGCIRRHDRTFTRPVLDGASVEELGL